MRTLLEVSGVSVSFDGFRAINNLSIQIGEPELRAVIGPNGAGKTTFMDIITGKTKPDRPRDLGRAERVAPVAVRKARSRGPGSGGSSRSPPCSRSRRCARTSPWRSAIRAGRSTCCWGRKTPEDSARIDEIAEEIGLLAHLSRRAGELSHGQKQWLEIGMLLAQDPRLLLVDEPAAGMTPAEREHTTDLLRRAAETRAVVVVEHDMEFVRRLDCKVTVLHEGSVLAEGSLDHVTKNQQVIDVYLGR
jgi:urea transport system ATP-binding protein